MGKGSSANTASTVITEGSRKYKQAVQAAMASDFGPALKMWLESSGILLKIACLSERASDLVHSYRTARELAVVTRSQMAISAYVIVSKALKGEVSKLRPGESALPQMRDALDAELRRSDAFLAEIQDIATMAKPSGVALVELTKAHSEVLQQWSKRLASLPTDHAAARAYRKFVSTVPSDDAAWATIAQLAIDRANSVKKQFPGLDAAALKKNSDARALIYNSYTWHGKGEMFEHFGKRYRETADAANRELHAAHQRAGVRGPEWTADATIGELRLGRAGEPVGNWSKFADEGVLIFPKSALADSASAADVPGGTLTVHGSAQPSALFQFKAESEKWQSALPFQQVNDLKRMLDSWEKGEAVYAATMIRNEKGEIVERVFLLEPPDPKAGLSFFGVGTQQARIAERDVLAARGALVTNIKADITNQELRSLWNELFSAAFDTRK